MSTHDTHMSTHMGKKIRVVALNALPIGAIQYGEFVIFARRVQLADIQKHVVAHAVKVDADEVEYIHYIRHPATLELIRKYLPELSPQPNAGLYQHQHGDILVVVTLKTPQRGQEVQQVREEDLDVVVATIH